MRGAQLEIVEVDTFPAHGDLDHAMKLAERKTRRRQNAPPHHRADPDQPEFDLEDRVGVHREVRNERLRPSFHATRLLPLSLSVAGHPRDPDALPESPGRSVTPWTRIKLSPFDRKGRSMIRSPKFCEPARVG